MINTLKLKFGRASGLAADPISVTPITIFVGPNNSGKSKILMEIYQYCNNGKQIVNDVILDDLIFDTFSPDKINDMLLKVIQRPSANQLLTSNQVVVGRGDNRDIVSRDVLYNAMLNPNDVSINKSRYCLWYLRHNTILLNGSGRIKLVSEQPGGDLLLEPRNSLQALFKDDNKREEVRRILNEAFGLYFVIDPTKSGSLRIRLSTRPPNKAVEERSLAAEAVLFHSQAMSIEEASDGIKAFTGIISEIIAGDPSIILIDEPEAFLHPALTYKLGLEIAKSTIGSVKRLFVSTHSSDFVMGCIQSGAPINIIRLTHRNEVATARILPNHDILKLMRNPLLRSTGVLEGLFYEFVIVTEGDTDRAFYQEINERLLRYRPELGIPNCLFVNAQNKQTVKTIIKPLRDLGIPVAGIVDVDIIKDGGSVWTDLLRDISVPEIEIQSYSASRIAIKDKINNSGKCMKQDGGIELLSESDKEAAVNLFDRLSKYGLFVVRQGELESWLPQLGCTGGKSGWLISVFDKMGEDPNSDNYLKPSDDDVWEFMGNIKQWLTNPNRKGIPL
ncbi:MAG: ATP-dependent nuclease [Armatimonadota bacterium]